MATKPSVRRSRGAAKARPGSSTGKKSRAGAKPKARSPIRRGARGVARPATLRFTHRRRPESLRLRSLSAGLTVGNLERSLRFYVDALGFVIRERWERGGRLAGVALVAGTCELTLSQDDWAKGRDRVKGTGFRIYAGTAQDLELLALRLRTHGFEAEGPQTAPWGARTVNVVDPDGFRITFHD